MDDAGRARAARRWAIGSIVFGIAVAILSAAGLALLPPSPTHVAVVATPTASVLDLPFVTPTPLRQASIQRAFIAPPSPQAAPTVTPTAAAPRPTPPPIQWTDAEKNALTWLCWYEIRGFLERKIDACLSVISTVRARYAYQSGFGTHDVISTIQAPGQFTGVIIDTTRPAPDPDLLWAVEQYAAGMRGSCNGYLYFDSLPSGPAECVIRASNGQWEKFHNAPK